MYAGHLLPSRLAPRRIRSVRPSVRSRAATDTYVSESLAGHADTIYDRERPVRVDRIRMGYASDPSAPLLAGLEAIRPIHGPSFNAPENDRSRPAGGEVTATAGRSQAHAAETTTTRLGRAGTVFLTPCNASAATERYLPNYSPNHHTTHVMGTYAPGELRRHLALELDRPVELTADALALRPAGFIGRLFTASQS